MYVELKDPKGGRVFTEAGESLTLKHVGAAVNLAAQRYGFGRGGKLDAPGWFWSMSKRTMNWLTDLAPRHDEVARESDLTHLAGMPVHTDDYRHFGEIALCFEEVLVVEGP